METDSNTYPNHSIPYHSNSMSHLQMCANVSDILQSWKNCEQKSEVNFRTGKKLKKN